MKQTITSHSPEETIEFARQLGSRLRGGEVIELVADLGGGKTTFVRGLAEGAGSSDAVASPTFTISKVYSTTKFDIHHFDFYRLPDPGLIAHELEDLLDDPRSVIVVEWADNLQHVLPKNRLTLHFETLGESERELNITLPSVYKYALPNPLV